MGAYRHDLLVAMRVVNKVEREMLQAEWESWLQGETRRCELVRELLVGNNGNNNNNSGGNGVVGQSVVGGLGGEEGSGEGQQQRRAALRKWFAEYCSSCAAEQRAVVERMGVGF